MCRPGVFGGSAVGEYPSQPSSELLNASKGLLRPLCARLCSGLVGRHLNDWWSDFYWDILLHFAAGFMGNSLWF